jgi:MOSC domain-containing protein YiiM
MDAPPAVEAIFLKPAHGQPMQRVEEAQAINGQGLQGDAAFGRKRRQVLIIDLETLDRFDLKPGQVRENLTLRGIRLAGLPAGTRLSIGAALLEITGDCAPCDHLESLRAGLRREMEGNRGVLAQVVRGAQIRVNDLVAIEAPVAPGRV